MKRPRDAQKPRSKKPRKASRKASYGNATAEEVARAMLTYRPKKSSPR